MEGLKQRLVNCQVGESFNADLEESQWTFQFKDEMSVCAGKFAIVPLDLHVAAIESLQPSEWVKVEDRLPEYYKNVLCYGKTHHYSDKVICTCWIASDGENYIYTITATDNIMTEVTHWMPLPTPPNR